MNETAPGQKLRRLRAILGNTQADFDQLVGANPGRTQSYEKKGSTVKPQRDYLTKLVDGLRSRVPNLSVDWFFNGVDDLPPGLKASAGPVSGFFEYPILQELPGNGATFNFGELAAAAATQYPEGTFWATIGDNDRKPAIRRGDHVLIVPEMALKPETIYVARRADDSIDLFEARRSAGALTLATIFDDQAEAGDGFAVAGKVVELRRQVGGGSIAFQSATGLSLAMITDSL